MLNGNSEARHTEDGTVPGEARFDIVHCDTARFFAELVRDLGGDPEALLRPSCEARTLAWVSAAARGG